VLSPGVDPTDQLKRLAEEKGVPFEAISMGRGQAGRAEKILSEGAELGNWIFLANCHLSISMLPDLEGKIDELFKHDVDQNFRLILSANPHPNFSISLLQRSIKVTQEPPKGIKANMLRLYGQKSEFTRVEKSREFRKAVYGLCFFHTILIERKKFQSLGWNVNYAFNESDYSVCEDILAIYMGQQNDEGKPIDESFDKKNPIPWPAIQSLIADCNYGGRITDNMDRRLIGVYAKEIFNDALVGLDKWKPNNTDDTMNYMYPFDEAAFKHPDLTQIFTPQFFYEELMNKMDDLDPPQVYGQHINAEISSQINDSKQMLASVLVLTPQKGGAGGAGGSSGVVKLIRELQEKVPELIDYFKLKMKLRGDENPLNVVLLQEVSRYAVLLKQLAKQLVQLERGSLGLEVISSDGELVLEALQQNRVPAAWAHAYFSLKPLANWF
jgi:dynein heavy chain